MNLLAPDRAAGLPLEPQRRHPPGRRRTGRSAGREAPGRRRSLRRDARARHRRGRLHRLPLRQAARCAAATTSCVLDKLTYAGNPANLEGTGIELVDGDIGDADAVAEAARGLRRDRQLRGRDARRPLDPRRDRLRPDRVLRHAGAARGGAPERAHASSRSRPTRSTATSTAGGSATETDPISRRARTASPRPAATCTSRPTCATFGVNASITRGSNTYGPNQYPEKLIPLFVTNALEGKQLPVYGDGRQIRDWLHVEDHCAGIELVLARGRAGRGLQRRRRQGAREHRRSSNAILGRSAPTSRCSATSRTAPGTTAATRSTPPSCARSAGRRGSASSRASRDDRRLVPRQPRLVGADQVGRVPRVLRAAVRRPARRAPRRRSPLGLLPQLADLLPLPWTCWSGRAARARRRTVRARGGEGEVVARVRLGELARPGEPATACSSSGSASS